MFHVEEWSCVFADVQNLSTAVVDNWMKKIKGRSNNHEESGQFFLRMFIHLCCRFTCFDPEIKKVNKINDLETACPVVNCMCVCLISFC